MVLNYTERCQLWSMMAFRTGGLVYVHNAGNLPRNFIATMMMTMVTGLITVMNVLNIL